MNHKLLTMLAAMLALAWVAAPVQAADQAPYIITSFEPGQPKPFSPKSPATKVVKEHASDGEYSMRVEGSTSEYVGMFCKDADALSHFKDYLLFKFDVYNPGAEPVTFILTMGDSKSVNYKSKYNNEGVTAAPGKTTTIEINLSGLNRSNAKGNTSTDLVNRADMREIQIFMPPVPKPGPGEAAKPMPVLFFDKFRLEPSGLPDVEGLKAIDFGGSGTPVYPGFTGCTEKNVWDPEKSEFGWIKPGLAGNCQMPDALTGDYGSGGAFKMKLPNGKYTVHACFDAFGMYGRFPTYTTRTVTLNGKKVLDQTMNGKEFLEKIYYAHEDEDDLPTDDLWNKFILTRNKIYTFETEVTDGTLTLQVDSPDKHGKYVMFLVAYPEAKKAEGQKFMDTLNKIRHDKFVQRIIIHTPLPTGDEVTATDADKARGFVPFVRHTELDINVNSKPFKAEIGKSVVIESAKGQRSGAQIGLYPLKEIKGLTCTVSELTGPDGAKIPSSAIEAKRIRYFFKRPGRVDMADVLPYILMDFKTMDLTAGTTKGIWLTLTVPQDAKPGKYTGKVIISPNRERSLETVQAGIPIELTVLPFTLDKVTDISMSVTGANSYTWRGWYGDREMEEQWWKGAEAVMKDLADHGMNCINGGTSARLISVKDGKATIDYTDLDRWMDLAMKYGLNKTADTYNGLGVSGVHRDTSADCIKRTEYFAQADWHMPFKDLVKIVYTDYDNHMKAKGYPKRAIHLLDEPRPEWSNVQSCGDLIKAYTAACPDSLFSGYYTTGQGRDEYFQNMPLSIAHVTDLALKLTKDAGKQLWEYDGDNVRYNMGRWCFVASRKGMSGYLRNGYIYVATDPYFDFADDEASWATVYPSRNGVNGTVGWERTAEGVNDYRYLVMLEGLIKKAQNINTPIPAAAEAQKFLAETLKDITIENRASAKLTPEQYDQFRHQMGQYIVTLKKALGEK